MLSRRRSSEQPSQSTQSTTPANRIENALRNVQILFSVPVVPDLHRPNLPRPPDHSGEIPQNDTSAMRRLFSRDQRSRKPAVHTLVVASTRNSTLRLYHVIDAVRVTYRYWNVAELHKIDGLGAHVSEGLHFALYFSNSKPVVFHTPTPRERATFLWSLLQTCVSRLERAPRVINLRLLDLETAAENEDDERLSTAYPSDPNLRLQASLEELPLSEVHVAHSDTSLSRPNSVPNTSSRHEDRPEEEHRSQDPKLKAHIRPRTPCKTQRVTRTLSEPKAIAMQPVRDNKKDQRQPVSTETGVRDMNIDERAFLAAAKRMGAKRSFEVGRYGKERFSSVGSDPKARLFQNRMKASDATTAKVVAERRLQQEKKHFRLSTGEQMDLIFALELFGQEKGTTALHDFGSWADGYIQALEAENIADLVNVEKRPPHYEVHESANGQLSLRDSQNEKTPQDLLLESMMYAEPWLEKCQTLLGPYAKLAKGINHDVITLERQRRNVEGLKEELDGLLQALTFEREEEALVSSLDAVDEASEISDVNYHHFHKAVQLITDKAAALSKQPSLSGMVAVRAVHRMISQKQDKASAALLPVLKKYLSKLYNAKDIDTLQFSFNESWFTEMINLNEDNDTTEFLRGAECLAVCGNNSFVELIDHYVTVSSSWLVEFLHVLMQEDVGENMVKARLDWRARLFAENMLYICIVEGMRAFRLFGSILDSSDRDGFISISGILRRQVSDSVLLEEYVTSQADGNKITEACVNLHFSQALDCFGDQLNNSTDEELQAILSRVEERNGIVSLSDVSSGRNRTKKGIVGGTITRHDRVIRESVSNFLVVCNEFSLTCYAVLERHISDVIARMDSSHDISTEQGRAGFFWRVVEAVDLCYELSSPEFSGLGSMDHKPDSSAKTKCLCERLIAAAMRSTEVASASGDDGVTDSMKLQCYGYIAAKLQEGKREDFLVQLAHLSSRVRKHVMTKWADATIFDTILGNLRLDGDKPTTETYSRFRNSVMELTALSTCSRVKETVNQTMESAANTCAILPFYADLINLVKERMEDVLRRVRKDKAVSDVRPKLLSFSRELLSNLKGEQKRLCEFLRNPES